jgi:hypothetical protein
MGGNLQRQPVTGPVLLVLAVATLSHIVYFSLRHFAMPGHQILALVSGILLFVSIAFGPFYVYIAAYLRGAGLPARIAAAGITPFAWMTKEVARLAESHPLAECLYWYLNPLNVWLVCLVVMELGLATVAARTLARRRGRTVDASPAGPLLVSAASLILVVSLYAWGKGENVYVLFLEGYRLLFGAGVG